MHISEQRQDWTYEKSPRQQKFNTLSKQTLYLSLANLAARFPFGSKVWGQWKSQRLRQQVAKSVLLQYEKNENKGKTGTSDRSEYASPLGFSTPKPNKYDKHKIVVPPAVSPKVGTLIPKDFLFNFKASSGSVWGLQFSALLSIRVNAIQCIYREY